MKVTVHEFTGSGFKVHENPEVLFPHAQSNYRTRAPTGKILVTLRARSTQNLPATYRLIVDFITDFDTSVLRTAGFLGVVFGTFFLYLGFVEF